MQRHGAVAGWHYRSKEPVEVAWSDGVITRVQRPSVLPDERRWIAPGLVDLQINGYAGIDFQRDDLTGAELLHAARELEIAGCTRFFVTLITDEWPHLIRRLKRLRSLRGEHDELRHAIAGWHIEGPFLSREPGYHGAHNPGVMLDPSAELIHELRSATGSDPLMLTLAPERPGSIDAIALARSHGITISLGHSDASAEILRQAVEAGATGFTHLGNACPQQLDRHDNILWRVFDTPGLTVSLIADGRHVSPPLFRLMHRALKSDAICYTTDAMSAAGAPPGRYTIGKLELEVGGDGIVRQPGKSNFAGSALRPIEGIKRATEMLGRTWQEVWDAYSVQPARWAGLPAGIEPGVPASFCVLEVAHGQIRPVINDGTRRTGLR